MFLTVMSILSASETPKSAGMTMYSSMVRGKCLFLMIEYITMIRSAKMLLSIVAQYTPLIDMDGTRISENRQTPMNPSNAVRMFTSTCFPELCA